MARYRKKLIEVEAIQRTEDNDSDVTMFIIHSNNVCYSIPKEECTDIFIDTDKGKTKVNVLDYIIKDLNNKLYVCDSYTFNRIYEEIEDKPLRIFDLKPGVYYKSDYVDSKSYDTIIKMENYALLVSVILVKSLDYNTMLFLK